MLKSRFSALLALVLLAAFSLPARAADPKPAEAKAPDAKAAKEDACTCADCKCGDCKCGEMKGDAKRDGDKKDDDDQPPPVVTAHSITIGGKEIKYHATAGYLLIKTEEGKPFVKPGTAAALKGLDDDGAAGKDEGAAAGKDDKYKNGVRAIGKIFFTAYTLDGVTDPATRPLTFLFNGGPGSASIWLHMGSVAPRRAVLTDEGEAPPPPYRLMDNDSTWLDRSDLVFIDPVSTGFSRPMPKEDAKQFHGLREDLASVGEFIRLYITRNERWLSPKIVVGESYGTTRAAGLSDYLQERYGLYLNGIVLLSSVIDFKYLAFTPQNQDPYMAFLPSYATTAWYHRKLSAEMQAKPVADVAQEARDFVANEYSRILIRGDRATEAEKAHAAAELSRLTGFPASQFRLLNLRMRDGLFSKSLLLDKGRYVGRYDSRFTTPSYSPGDPQEDEDYDPSSEASDPPMTAAFNDYVRRELKFKSDLPYEGLTDVQPWNFGDAGGGFPNTGDLLRKAMTRNPYLRVWVTCSYYDMATPFFGAESAMAGMELDPSIRPNLRITYYESGHMLYIHNPSRIKFKADFIDFLKDATSQTVVHSAAR